MREWINQSKIDLLAREIGEENVPILVNIFLGELNDYQCKLVSEAVTDKLEYLKEISHALKSSAASFGADRLCAKAVELDSRAKSGEMIDISLEVEQMLELLKHTHQCYSDLVH
ncbi:quorum-sensing phosphorelay protein LuxU [Vibrio mimicus]|uniref:Phosphorelay protein LuxU n=1 Tax=Vibrio mimicus TaxID=674 RepID=A0A2J9V258_VIBMI|nr:quorum-sensing phosphorelay protein LuxU [Vibrio mimicus]EEW10783.1 phosphorelay protein [Vibrio mimicus VM573]EGU20376.1 phosphorelay protein [Vibrio mimicus SX-4]KFE32093.1 hpt domain protein [Vibrio mimicus]PNM57869.1 Hpt domain-containing protein [Vibrio mimicus]TXY47355.1 Hpt domain-containing protein [Vibrio mimicus]